MHINNKYLKKMFEWLNPKLLTVTEPLLKSAHRETVFVASPLQFSAPHTRLTPSVCADVSRRPPVPLLSLSQSPLDRPGCCCLLSFILVPSTGSIWCQILQGQLEEAANQLEFLKEVQQSLGKSEVRANGEDGSWVESPAEGHQNGPPYSLHAHSGRSPSQPRL